MSTLGAKLGGSDAAEVYAADVDAADVVQGPLAVKVLRSAVHLSFRARWHQRCA